MPHITQICAKEYRSGQVFSCYVVPKREIELGAEQTTGISCEPASSSSPAIMRHNNVIVTSKSCKEALLAFLDFCRPHSSIILAAHNCRNFDSKVLTAALQNTGLIQDFLDIVVAYGDTLKLSKTLHKGLNSYRQEDLVTNFLKQTYEAHNAVGDVEALVTLLHHWKVSPQDMAKYTFGTRECHYQKEFLQQKSKHLASYDELATRTVIKRSTAENLAGSGLSLRHVQLIYKRKGSDGLRDSFSGKNEAGRPRITDTKKTLDELVSKLSSYFDSLEQ